MLTPLNGCARSFRAWRSLENRAGQQFLREVRNTRRLESKKKAGRLKALRRSIE